MDGHEQDKHMFLLKKPIVKWSAAESHNNSGILFIIYSMVDVKLRYHIHLMVYKQTLAILKVVCMFSVILVNKMFLVIKMCKANKF